MRTIYLKIRQLHFAYPYVAMLLFVLAFMLAFVFMFIFPPASLGLLFLGLFGLAGVVIFRVTIAALSAFLVRRLIRGGICPECGERSAAFDQDCPSCGAAFTSDGKLRVHPGLADLAAAAPKAD